MNDVVEDNFFTNSNAEVFFNVTFEPYYMPGQ